MTRTEDDLRRVLQTPVEAAAAHRVLERVVAAPAPPGPARRRPARIGLVTALALVVVVGAVFAVLAVRPDRRPTPPAVPTVSARPSPSPSTSAVVAAPTALSVDSTVIAFPAGSGYQAGLSTFFPDDQSVDAVPVGGTAAVATVHVGAGGTPTPAGTRAPVDLGGGVSATWVIAPGGEGVVPLGNALAWSDAGTHRTVTVSPNFDGATDADVEAVARAVVIGPAVAVRVPVSVASWPDGWVLDGLVSTYVHRDGATGNAGRDVLVDIGVDGDTSSTAVTIDTAGLAFAGGDASVGDPVVIGDRTWRWDATSSTFTWAGPDRFVRVTSLNQGIGRDPLQSLVTALTLAPDFGDEATWFDATAAFPS